MEMNAEVSNPVDYIGTAFEIYRFQVIIPCSQYANIYLNPSPKPNPSPNPNPNPNHNPNPNQRSICHV